MSAKKKQVSNGKNNSKFVTKVTSTPKSKEEIKLTPDSVVILTIYERGAVKKIDTSKNPVARTEYFEVATRTKLSNDAVMYFTSEEGNPSTRLYGKAFWNRMSKIQRLKANLAYTADGREYEFSIVN